MCTYPDGVRGAQVHKRPKCLCLSMLFGSIAVFNEPYATQPTGEVHVLAIMAWVLPEHFYRLL